MWSLLVDAQTLAMHADEPRLRILDCRHKLTDPEWGPNEYRRGHLPGAVHAHVDHDLSAPPTPATGRHPLPDPQRFRAACERWGIDASTQVVVYDDAGGVWAARAWWLLRHYGHEKVALLDGGIDAWKAIGQPLTPEVPRIRPTRFQGEPGHMPTVHAAQILQSLPGHTLTLLDARASERYLGEVEPIDPVAGHIPGARSLPAASLVGPGKRLLGPDELRRRFDQAAQAPPAATVAYCGSGVTGAHLVLAAEVAGRGRIALYPGSWSEWIRDAARPVERGEPPPTGATPKTR